MTKIHFDIDGHDRINQEDEPFYNTDSKIWNSSIFYFISFQYKVYGGKYESENTFSKQEERDWGQMHGWNCWAWFSQGALGVRK